VVVLLIVNYRTTTVADRFLECACAMEAAWVAGKTVWSPCYTRAISERFRDQELVYKALYKFSRLLHLLYVVSLKSRHEVRRFELQPMWVWISRISTVWTAWTGWDVARLRRCWP